MLNTPEELKWSGIGRVPAVGEIVRVKINGLGDAKVAGYFHDGGYLGLLVIVLDPPKWFVEQNKNAKREECGVFGAEIDMLSWTVK